MVWLMGGGLTIALAMIAGLLLLILIQGFGTFWPGRLVRVQLAGGGQAVLGEVARRESYVPGPGEFAGMTPERRSEAEAALARSGGRAGRRLFRTGNFDIAGTHFQWVEEGRVREESEPEWAVLVERLNWGIFIGTPRSLRTDGQDVAQGPAAAMAKFARLIGEVAQRRERRRALEGNDCARINRAVEESRLGVRAVELRRGRGSTAHLAAQADHERRRAAAEAGYARIRARIDALDRENARHELVMVAADGTEKAIPLALIVRAYPANRLGIVGRLGVYFSRWVEFLTADPREANTEGGIYPAIFGTVVMTLIMSIFVVPFGVLAALYLREYARKGPIVSAVRIAINNLAGVPSIVFGVFGLGFFCYIIGASLDQLFFAARLPNPTYGKGGILWASLTLALLTLPVVIVATEEALAAVPGSMREGSYACGASKWQTIRRIVLPRAMPGVITGMILAVARGAGEVAPLMMVGALKTASELPVDASFPFIHPDRGFMHLGFHIYDLGFQSPNSEAAKPMVYTTVFLLILIVAVLNLSATWLRRRLRRAHGAGQF